MLAHSPHILAIIQARMASSRLPGKVLLTINEKPMLAHVVERTRQAETVDQVVVATTTDPADDPLVEMCQNLGIKTFRGSQHDVLDRYYETAKKTSADIIVRITADCPLIDPELVDSTVRWFLGEDGLQLERKESRFPWDFAANRLPPPWGRTYPIGLDTEVCSFSALKQCWQEATLPHHREHVLPYLYEYSPIADSRHLESYRPPEPGTIQDGKPQFRALLVNHSEDYGNLRWTVDTAQDLQLVRMIYTHFRPREMFSWQEVLDYILAHPELNEINAAVRHKSLHDVDNRQN